MIATDELRRLLDERGVEYTVVHGYHEYIWEFGESGIARASAIGTRGLVQMIVTGITPAQAIEATLGPREQPPYDELIEALRRDWDIEASWDGLRRFWYVGLTDEGVRKRDEREATLGRGTCRITDERYKECMALVQEANERIDELRELVRDLYGLAWPECPGAAEAYLPRIQSLGVEVDE